jgi:hypothetical protein
MSSPWPPRVTALTSFVPEIEHRYGANVHLLADPFLLDLLAKLAAKETEQPVVNNLMVDIYRSLARAGAVPSHTVYDMLNTVLVPKLVRQDDIIRSRMPGDAEQVVGAGIGRMKIGGDVDGAFLLFPDPTGATGSSLSMALDTYKKKMPETPRKIIALHLVVTPEYLRRIGDGARDLLGRGEGVERPRPHRPRGRRPRRGDEQRVGLTAPASEGAGATRAAGSRIASARPGDRAGRVRTSTES